MRSDIDVVQRADAAELPQVDLVQANLEIVDAVLTVDCDDVGANTNWSLAPPPMSVSLDSVAKITSLPSVPSRRTPWLLRALDEDEVHGVVNGRSSLATVTVILSVAGGCGYCSVLAPVGS